MKKVLTLPILCVIFIFSFNFVSAEIGAENEKQIWERLSFIVNSINDNSNVENIYNVISPNASENLIEEIKKNIEGQKLQYGIQLEDIEEISSEKVRLDCNFVAIKNVGYIIHFTSRIDGLKTYFIFEKIDGEWYLLESDFAKKLDGKIFNFVFISIPLIFGFWIWMLVDVANKPIKRKTVWVLVIVFFNFIGAILYFIIVRRKYKKNLKEEIVE